MYTVLSSSFTQHLYRSLLTFHKLCIIFYFLIIFSYGDFQAYTRQKKHKTYILKPESGCQGKGIWVTKNPKEIKPHEHMLCQQYISKVSLSSK